MKIYRKKSKLGKFNIPVFEITPTQFQLYLDKVFNPETQEGLPGLILLIINGGLMIFSSKEDPAELSNRRSERCFSDLVRLVAFQNNPSVYAIAGTHRLAAISLANRLYKTRDYLRGEEYDLAEIGSLNEFKDWRNKEFALQKIKGSPIGQPYESFNFIERQKGFDIQVTAENGGKRIFVKKCVNSFEELILKNAPSLIKRLNYLLKNNLIKKKEEVLIAKDIISFLDKR